MCYTPKRAVWELTFKCNISCLHCGSDCISKEKPSQLTTAECLTIVENLAKLGCKSVVLSGGEPFLRKDWAIIANAIKKNGMSVSFISNGYLINENKVKLLHELKPNAVGVSIDAGEPYLHDYIRGKEGSFEKIINALQLLKKYKIASSVVTTIQRINFDQLHKIRKVLIENGVKYWQIQIASPIGRMTKEFTVTEAQFYEIAKFIAETKQKYKKQFEIVSGADCFGYYGNLSSCLMPKGWRGCHAGMNAIGIESDGSIRGCLSLQIDGFVEDSIKNRSLCEIWNDPESFKYNRRFEHEQLSGYCAECLYADVCQGGCLKRAMSFTGKRDNPLCLYKIEQIGFSNEQESQICLDPKETALLYNRFRALPQQYYINNSIVENSV